MTNSILCPVCKKTAEKEIHADKRVLLLDSQGGQLTLPVTLLICKACGHVDIRKREEMERVEPVAEPAPATESVAETKPTE